jgi:hypothetical protein
VLIADVIAEPPVSRVRPWRGVSARRQILPAALAARKDKSLSTTCKDGRAEPPLRFMA